MIIALLVIVIGLGIILSFIGKNPDIKCPICKNKIYLKDYNDGVDIYKCPKCGKEINIKYE